MNATTEGDSSGTVKFHISLEKLMFACFSPQPATSLELLMTCVDVGQSLLHYLLLMCSGVATEVWRRLTTNKPKLHCCHGPSFQEETGLSSIFSSGT